MTSTTDPLIQQIAEFAGHNALLLFGIGTALLLLATWIAWQLIDRFGGRLQQNVIAGSRRLLRLLDTHLLNGRLGAIDPGEYLVLHAVVGFAVVFPALAIFFELTDALTPEEELGQFDHALAHTLRLTITDNIYQFFA
ncbi:MAG TPA: hypothetical protein VM553_21945, partial [Dongiaceae bacterium]|nr:hypothetical protein [Dongiaceae bacterium]